MVEDMRAAKKDWVALAVLMLPVLLVSIDNTVLSLALPSISKTLTPSATQLLWVVDSYSLVLAGLLVSMGSLGDIFGRRKMLLIGAVGFTFISVFAAYSVNAQMLIFSRVFMGVFGAMLMPATLSLIRNIFHVREQRRLAIAIWASCFSAGAALGPIVGGVLLEYFWWGSVFLLAVPVMIVLIVCAPFLIPESKNPNPAKINFVAIVLLFCTIIPVVYSIKVVAHDGVNLKSLVLVVVGLFVGFVFVKMQLKSRNPLLEIDLFRSKVFTGAVNINLFSTFALVGALLFISQHLQLVLGLSPLQAAFKLTPGLLLMIVASLSVVYVVRFVQPGKIVVFAIFLASMGYVVIALFGSSPNSLGIVVAFALLGVGIGSAETLANDFIISAVPAEKAGAASGISETAYELGVVLGTSIIGGILTATYSNKVVMPAGLSAQQQVQATETLGGAVNVSESLSLLEATQLLNSAHKAFESGATIISVVGAVLMLALTVLAWVTLKDAKSK